MNNGHTTQAEPKLEKQPFSPRLKIACQQINSVWIAQVIVALEKGSMEQNFKFDTYEQMMRGIPLILTEVKEKFYAGST